MASFGGIDIFGTAVVIRPVPNPRARQTNEFPGINGVESLDQGGRGGKFEIEGRFLCASLADLGSGFGQWDTLNDGVARLLIDTAGRAWPSVLIDWIKPSGRIRRLDGGGASQDYTASMTALI